MKDADVFDALGKVVEALKSLQPQHQENVLRWAREHLGLPSSVPAVSVEIPKNPAPAATLADRERAPRLDIKQFVGQKVPKTDSQFTAVVAYYHQFVAPENERKTEISKDDLVAACRLAEWK